MKDSWCLATNHAELTSAEIINLYGRRITVAEAFRDVKDQRFGMGSGRRREDLAEIGYGV